AHAPEAFEAALVPGAEVAHILALALGPEGHILRVESALGNERLLLLRPVDAVGAVEGVQPRLARARDGLVPFGLGYAGARILEGRKVVGEGRLIGQENV